ncbi:MAG TPA: MarC family protein [Kiloniellaceae bacterium]|nr:MarC family protein [Kiloniellaceae bacterium]
MDFSVITLPMVVNLALLLLIGLGPKIALVPFLEKTGKMAPEQQRAIGTTMVKTAVITALVLFVFGALLMRLLHVSSGSVSVAGGVVLLIMALQMLMRPGEPHEPENEAPLDHEQLAIYPLAIPYLLNPVGIAVLLVASSEVDGWAPAALVVGLVLAVGALDWVVFRNADKISKRLNPSTLVISEVIFGILLAALAVELAVAGLGNLGIIEPVVQHH